MIKKTAALAAILLLAAMLLSPAAYGTDSENATVVLRQILRVSEGERGNGWIDATTEMMTLGAATADAVRELADADAAIVFGGDLHSNLFRGELTIAQVREAFNPDRELAVAEVSYSQLAEMLEAGVSHIVVNQQERIDREESSFGGFPQVSGFSFSYDVSAPIGSRVSSVTLADGREIDLSDGSSVLVIAGAADMFAGEYGYPEVECEPLGATESDALIAAIRAGLQEYTDANTLRISVLGDAERLLTATGNIRWALLVGSLLLTALILLTRRKTDVYVNGDDEFIDSHSKREKTD